MISLARELVSLSNRCCAMKAVSLSVLLMFLLNCDFSNKSSSNKNKITIPSFAVSPFPYSSVEDAQALRLTGSPDCKGDLLTKSNEANKNAQLAILDAIDEDELTADLALALTKDGYQEIIFRDCNIREQASEDGAELVSDDTTKALYRSFRGDESKLLDLTRFVEWSEYKDNTGTITKLNGEAEIITGKMSNLYSLNNLYDKGKVPRYSENTLQLMLLELDKRLPLREVTHLSWWGAEDRSSVRLAKREHFVEYNKDGTKEQLIGLRYYHGDPASTWLVLAHMKSNGAAILVGKCAIKAREDYNESCKDTKFETFYVDAAGAKMDADESFKSTLEDFLNDKDAKWAYGDYDAAALDPREPFFAVGKNDTLADVIEDVFTEGVVSVPEPAESPAPSSPPAS